MGNAESSSQEELSERHGFHVLRVIGSARRSGIEPFFDYVVAVDGARVDGGSHRDSALAEKLGGDAATLSVLSTKTRTERLVAVQRDAKSGAFGLTVRRCSLARPRTWRILDVLAKSPAEHAGLHPQSDYILGVSFDNTIEDSDPIILRTRDSLFELMHARVGTAVPLIVYSSVMDNLRIVHLAPRFDWGGPGCMGCDIGYGPQHQIPNPLDNISLKLTTNGIENPGPSSSPSSPCTKIMDTIMDTIMEAIITANIHLTKPITFPMNPIVEVPN